MRLATAALALTLSTGPALAEEPWPTDPAVQDFVASALIWTFYHEVGHALVDRLSLPVLGREEDAADALAVLLIDAFWEERSAQALIVDAATAFALYAIETDGDEGALWGEHSLDTQRQAALLCLFYGVSPIARHGLAREMGLPEDRRDECPVEAAQTADSWWGLLDDATPQDGLPAFRLIGSAADGPISALIAAEIEALNATFGLPQTVRVTVEPCGEANAFYDGRSGQIVMCTDYAEDLARLYAD
jgi:hypothetical protein